MSVRYSVIYEKGPTSWGASVPDLPGCIAVGVNRQEVERLIREAIEGHLDAMRECDIACPRAASRGWRSGSDCGVAVR
ncbi:MAG: type II toxin-antitoxin system HicB family antitoxin [Bryobacteraceae bacterium]|jgi:predicted RNase H-like HicB family nuclease